MSGLEIIERKHSPNEPSSPIEVTVRHSGIESRIIGNPESALRELISYFSKTYPSIELVSKLILSVASTECLQICTGILATSPEGLVVLNILDRLTYKE